MFTKLPPFGSNTSKTKDMEKVSEEFLVGEIELPISGFN
jgi:hypothetical protein